MDTVEKIVVFAVTFCFIAFLFPTIREATANVNETLTVAPLIKTFPYLFLGAVILFLVYFMYGRERG